MCVVKEVKAGEVCVVVIIVYQHWEWNTGLWNCYEVLYNLNYVLSLYFEALSCYVSTDWSETH
jgi:hypothetical protein